MTAAWSCSAEPMRRRPTSPTSRAAARSRGDRLRAGEALPLLRRAPTPVSWMDEIFHHRPWPDRNRTSRRVNAGSREPRRRGCPPPCPTPALPAGDPRGPPRTGTASRRLEGLPAPRDRLSPPLEARVGAAGGHQPSPENMEQVLNAPLQTRLLMNRFRQLITSLNFAVQTTPPPRTREERVELQNLHLELYQLFLGVNYLDLARDHFQAALAVAAPGDIPPEVRISMTTELAQLDERMLEVQTRMGDLAIEQQAGPLERASFAMSQGAPGLALRELEEAEQLSGRAPGSSSRNSSTSTATPASPRRRGPAGRERRRRRPDPGHRARRRGPPSGTGSPPARQLRIRGDVLATAGDPANPV